MNMTRDIFLAGIDSYIEFLTNAEKSENTIAKYHLGIRTFIEFAESQGWQTTLKEGIIKYKRHLECKYKLTTANLYLIALNKYLKYIGQDDLCVTTFRIQEKNSLDIMTMKDYERMLTTAKDKNKDVYYLLKALAGTGVRVDELRFFTVAALKQKGCEVRNKGKSRDVVISNSLCNELLEYCAKKNIVHGYVFYVRSSDKYICESTALRRLKSIAKLAGVDEMKVSARNLRHLFAKRYMEVVGNISGLKHILGHENIKTTMIYTCTSNAEKRKDIDRLGF